jgi:hypothetical protein
MNALVSGFFGAGHCIVSPRQADFEYDTAASTQKTVKLRGTRVIRYWFNNPRPSRAPQGYAGLAG